MNCSLVATMESPGEGGDAEEVQELAMGAAGWSDFSPAKGQVIEVFLADTDIEPPALGHRRWNFDFGMQKFGWSKCRNRCCTVWTFQSSKEFYPSLCRPSVRSRGRGLLPCQQSSLVERRNGYLQGRISFGQASSRQMVEPRRSSFRGKRHSTRRSYQSGIRKTSSIAARQINSGWHESRAQGWKEGGQEEARGRGNWTHQEGCPREKAEGVEVEIEGPYGIESHGSEGDQGDHSSAEDVESSPAQEGLTTGMTLATSGIPGATKKIQERREAKKKKSKESELALVASRGSTSKGYQGQLVGKALAVSQTNAEEKKRSTSSSSKLGATLAKILTKEVTKNKGKKKRKKEKKKKRKRRREKGGDPGDEGDGYTSSSSPSSSGEIDNSEDNSNKSGDSPSSDEELEAPLRKKSKKNPGSVLELLVSHAREQLDQSASVGVGREEDHYLTTGIKVMTYFQVLLKPKLGGSQALQREMHHLATAIDLLRQGRLGLLGDTLAARFLCLHQSILDGHWSAARHLEIFPMEETSAASTALLLKTRKHARLAAKALGADGGGNFWSSYGPGRKGKGKQDWQGGDVRDGKGKGKKGAKGKNKKGKQNWWHDSERQGEQEWKDTKESKGGK